MSEAQLNRLLAQNEQLSKQLQRSNEIIKASEACETLVQFSTKTADPFLPGWTEVNPYHSEYKGKKGGGGGGLCSII